MSIVELVESPGRTISPHTVEHAKGALMLRYGINSHQAFAVLVRWARESGTDVGEIAHILMHGICQGHVAVEVREGHLVRWVEEQLRQNIG